MYLKLKVVSKAISVNITYITLLRSNLNHMFSIITGIQDAKRQRETG